jgi:hypothetical protein
MLMLVIHRFFGVDRDELEDGRKVVVFLYHPVDESLIARQRIVDAVTS